jgi:diaminopimelate decarboxylase
VTLDLHFLQELKRRFGLPAYLYDARVLDRRADELRSLLPHARIFYSMKANPLPTIVERLVGRGMDLEISSEGELAVALGSGCPADRILMTGPGKMPGLLRQAMLAGVATFSCESPTDFERIVQVAAGRPVGLLLRLNPKESTVAGLSMSGTSTQFGFSEEHAQAFAASLQSAGMPTNVRLLGIHVYYGTQVRDPAILSAVFARIERAATEFQASTGCAVSVIDFGGGFPWAHGKGDLPFDLGAVRTPAPQAARSWYESGRYLVASAGTFVSEVLDIKVSREKTYLVLDAGINHFGGMPALGRLNALNPDVRLVRGTERVEGPESAVQLVGPLCSPLDLLGRDAALPQARIGDLVCIPNVGAYGATASLTGFLSHPGAAEILHDGVSVLSAHRLRSGHESIPSEQ